MPTTDASTTPTTQARMPKRRTHRQPGPFPVTIVRPPTTVTAALTAAQRYRRRAASQLAHHLTEAARTAIAPQIDTPKYLRLHETQHGPAIIRDAPAIAADPPPGALQIGRTLRGRPAAIVVHADTWSLVLRPTPQPPDTGTPTSWAFLDGYGQHNGLTFMDFCFDNDPGALGDEWRAMVRRLLSIAP